METYKEFSERINSFEKERLNLGNGYFKVNPSLLQKVNADNTFKNFYGDTVVFALNDSIKRTLENYLDLLPRQCFCQRLNPATFHMTLHDLSNSCSLCDIEKEVSANERTIRRMLPRLQKCKIKVKSKYLFNMVNTSLVLDVYPASEADYRRLADLYCIFDEVKKLDHPFTPHITLAYYNVNGFDTRSAEILENTVNRLNENQLEFELDDLYYQKFKSMNGYADIIKLL